VTLYDAAPEIGGQFNWPSAFPGKEEFHETLRYFRRRLELLKRPRAPGRARVGVEDAARRRTTSSCWRPASSRDGRAFSRRRPSARCCPISRCCARASATWGKRVAIVGAGGIGFDVAEFLVHEDHSPSSIDRRGVAWGTGAWSTRRLSARGGVRGREAQEPSKAARQVWLLQRKTSKPGAGLGKTTGWIHRAALKSHGVEMLSGVTYDGVDDRGLHITVEAEAIACSKSITSFCARARSHCGISSPTCWRRGGACIASAARMSPPSWTQSAPSTRARGSPRPSEPSFRRR
jgi:2,4-dienoyl-CoA reductase (NADPH2)